MAEMVCCFRFPASGGDMKLPCERRLSMLSWTISGFFVLLLVQARTRAPWDRRIPGEHASPG